MIVGVETATAGSAGTGGLASTRFFVRFSGRPAGVDLLAKTTSIRLMHSNHFPVRRQ
jgi:hypothetical protein